MSEDPKAKAVLERYNAMKSERSTYENVWQDIRELIRPNTSDFQRRGSPGEVRTDRIYDGTAPQALEDLAGALHTYLTSPTERWFALELENEPELNREPEVVGWLEQVSDTIYKEYSKGNSGFNAAMHECYLDIGGFGNAVLNQEYDAGRRGLIFRDYPLNDCYAEEDAYGKIDTVARLLPMTPRQLVQLFNGAVPADVAAAKDRKYDVIHMVFPREDRVYGKSDAMNKAYASCWVLKDKAITLKEAGYDTFPYHVGRWSKIAGEIYGRGPAIKCLPDVRMLNRMELVIIKAAQKATDPPLVVPSDGFTMPIATSPGSLIFKEPGSEEIQSLEHKGNFPIALETSEQKRNFIRQCFYADWVKLMPKKERQTAYEIAELVEQQLRMMAPMLGRLETEFFSPMIARSYGLLLQAGRFPEPPSLIERRALSVVYISAASRAQTGTKAMAMGRFSQELLPLAQVKPDIVDAIDTDAFAQGLADIRGVSRRWLRSPRQIAEIRKARAEQEQLAAAVEAIEPASQAVKNLSEANQAGNIF